VFLTALTTLLQAATNHSVDVVLAIVLMLGGLTGAHFGAVAGERFKPEQLRLVLAALVLLIGLRFAWQLIAPPTDVYSISDAFG
jgi:uncharacterized membrane protein YfcA